MLSFTTVIVHAAPTRPLATLIYADKDGYLSSRGSNSTYKEIWVQGSGNVISWIGFDLRGYTFARTKTCMLSLYITSVKSGGLCDVHAITSPLLIAESRVTSKSLHYDDIPLLTVPLDSTYSGQMLFVNITEVAKSGTFHGIVLQSRGNCDASFEAREGSIAPVILCTHDTATTNAVSWFCSVEKPDRQTGKNGDFLVRTSNGALYYKSETGWDSINVLRETVKPVPVRKNISHRPLKRTRAASRK